MDGVVEELKRNALGRAVMMKTSEVMLTWDVNQLWIVADSLWRINRLSFEFCKIYENKKLKINVI